MSSTSGRIFRVTTFGESHGPAVGCVVDGCPPRLPLDIEAIQADLDRRRPGQSRLVTQRQEADRVEILSGVQGGTTLGTPIAMLVRNTDQRPGAYSEMAPLFRPSHADYTYQAKYGVQASSGGGRASARETIGRVAAAAIARQLLRVEAGIEVLAWVESIHDIQAEVDDSVDLEAVESDPTRCPDPEAAAAMTSAIEAARKAGDSLGGIVRAVARNVPPGLGDPVFDKLTATIAAAVMSLPATRGVEFGLGFGATRLTGITHNDPFIPDPNGSGRIRTASNNSGGIQGGISNGELIELAVAFKPTATIAAEQQTVNAAGEPVTLAAKGRHDPCVLPRAVPLVEAAVLLALADHYLIQRTVDVLPQT
jgi:chorismate synthase